MTIAVLRENIDSLMSVLETFVHDPLVEWNHKKRVSASKAIGSSFASDARSAFSLKSKTSEETDELMRKEARKALDPILRKLKGLQVTSVPTQSEKVVTVGNQVDSLIREATDSRNLVSVRLHEESDPLLKCGHGRARCTLGKNGSFPLDRSSTTVRLF